MCSIQQVVQVVGYQIQHSARVGGAIDNQVIATALPIAVRQRNDWRGALLLQLQIVIAYSDDAVC